MTNYLYKSKQTCPLCKKTYESIKVRNSKLIILSRYSDFYTQYKEIDPLRYTIIVCPYCGYAGPDYAYEIQKKEDRLAIYEQLKDRQLTINFNKERDLNLALSTYKLAIYVQGFRKEASGILGGLYLRAGWLHRFEQDPINDPYSPGPDEELPYLKQALTHYLKAYELEVRPPGNMNKPTFEYLIGELYRRTQNPAEAITWYNKVVSDPRNKAYPAILKMAREAWHVCSNSNT